MKISRYTVRDHWKELTIGMMSLTAHIEWLPGV